MSSRSLRALTELGGQACLEDCQCGLSRRVARAGLGTLLIRVRGFTVFKARCEVIALNSEM
jgi:hypothetical protein